VIGVIDEDQAAADLEGGRLSCGCGGQLRPLGYAAARVVRHRGGGESRRRWRRGRCAACGRTHVVVAGVWPRRRDDLATIGEALVAAADGAGHRPISRRLGVPAATVRGWLRRARANAAEWASAALAAAHDLDRDLGRVRPTGTALGDALQTLGTAAAAAARRFGLSSSQHAWQLVANISRGQLLAPPSG
jgi:Homeodomain-like domain